MITLYILYKLFFAGAKEKSYKDYASEEEDDYEEMLIMGMVDDK